MIGGGGFLLFWNDKDRFPVHPIFAGLGGGTGTPRIISPPRTHWTGPRRRRHVTASKQPKPWTKATRPCQPLGRTRTGGPLLARPCFVVLAVALARPPPTTPPISCFHRFVASPCMHAWDRVVSRSSSVYWFAHHIIPWSMWSLPFL
jgi:hypothetical protein